MFFLYSNVFYAMENHLEKTKHRVREQAYCKFRGCNLCNIKEPKVPILAIQTTDGCIYDNKKCLLYTLGSTEKSLCPHSSMGPYVALSSFYKKKNGYQQVIEMDDSTLLNTKKIEKLDKIGYPINLIVKNVLFMGSNFDVKTSWKSNRVNNQISDFFVAAHQNQFDVYEILIERWGQERAIKIFEKWEKMQAHQEDTANNSLNSDEEAVIASFSSYKKDLSQKKSTARNIGPFMALSWHTKIGKKRIELLGADYGVNAFAVSSDSSLKASIHMYNKKDKLCLVWNARTGKVAATLIDTIPDIKSLEFSANNIFLIAKSTDGSCDLLFEIKEESKNLHCIGKYCALAFNASMEKIALSDYENTVSLFNTYTKEMDEKETFKRTIKAMAFNESGSILLLAGICNTGTMFSIWHFGCSQKRDILFISSTPNCLASTFSWVKFNNANKVLLVSGNSFVLGALRLF
jgi:hypothetical protein